MAKLIDKFLRVLSFNKNNGISDIQSAYIKNTPGKQEHKKEHEKSCGNIEYLISTIKSNVMVSELERRFLKDFLEATHGLVELKYIKINRLSTKVLNFTYKRAQIGRIKLQGRKTSMQCLFQDDGVEWNYNLEYDEYEKRLAFWAERIIFLKKKSY